MTDKLPDSLCPPCTIVPTKEEKPLFVEPLPDLMPPVQENLVPRYRQFFEDIVANRWCTDNPPPDLVFLTDPDYEEIVYRTYCPAYPEFYPMAYTGQEASFEFNPIRLFSVTYSCGTCLLMDINTYEA